MIEFDIINDINYQELIDEFVLAIKYTITVHSNENIDNKKQLKNTLNDIIKNNCYLGITKKYGQRDKILKHTKDEYFNMIVYLLKRYNLSNYLFKNNKKYQINIEYISQFIERACQDFLYEKLDKTYVTIQDNNHFSPENVNYYSPSEKLRQSIINGNQTSVRNSSYNFNGMFAYSDVGKKRTNQEDSYYIGVHPKNPNFKIMIVADGMGGYENGEVASNIAVKELMTWFDSIDSTEYNNKNNNQLANLISKKINEINDKICSKIIDGGTTLCVAIIKDSSIIMCNIGDSQGYIFENSILRYETKPDSATNNPNIPEDIARFHRYNNGITNYLGKADGEKIVPKLNIVQYPLHQFRTYRVILCSDGVTDCISKRDIKKIVNENNDSSKSLVEYAISNPSYLKDEIELLEVADRQKARFLYNSGYLYNYIEPGKDNTTAISGIIKK